MASFVFGVAQLDQHAGDLIGAWNLDEESGDRADQFGSRTLADENTVGFTAGKKINAADFERTNSEYFHNASEITAGLTQFSASFWLKLETVDTEQYILWEPTSTGNTRLGVSVASTNQMGLFMRDAAGGAVTATWSTSKLEVDTWYHILVVFDTVADKIQAWVNGTSWVDAAKTMDAFHIDAANADWRVGGHSGGIHLDGLLDELVMWSAALDIDDATALYNGGAGRFYSSWASHIASGVEFTSITKREDGSWRFEWDAESGVSYEVWLNGVLEATVDEGQWDSEAPEYWAEAYATTPPPIEVVAVDGTIESYDHPPFLTLQWKSIMEAFAYEVFEENSIRGRLIEDGLLFYRNYQTLKLDDGVVAEWTVDAITDTGESGEGVTFNKLIVRNPDPPDVEMSYSAGDLTISEA